MLIPTYPIETARLCLRPFTSYDYDAFYALYSRADVTRYLYYTPQNPDQAAAMLNARIHQSTLTETGKLCTAIERRDSGQVIGEALLFWTNAEHQQGEIGYVLHPDHHGQGFATEAAREMLRLGFEGLSLHRIVARCDARNLASRRVMEKLGLRLEAHLRENEYVKGEWCDELIYAVLHSEWERYRG